LNQAARGYVAHNMPFLPHNFIPAGIVKMTISDNTQTYAATSERKVIVNPAAIPHLIILW
jgi:hypothetical protein